MQNLQRALDILSPLISPSRRAKFVEVLSARTNQVTLVFENLQNEFNCGSCLRTADAFGIHSVYVIERFEQFLPSSSSSKASERWLQVNHYNSTSSCIASLRNHGYSIWASSLEEQTMAIDRIPSLNSSLTWTPSIKENLYPTPSSRKFAFVFGNEHRGVSTTMIKQSDGSFILPMCGFVQSLNVSVSVAVCLTYARHFKLLQANLSDQEKLEMQFLWTVKDIPNSYLILKRNGIEMDQL